MGEVLDALTGNGPPATPLSDALPDQVDHVWYGRLGASLGEVRPRVCYVRSDGRTYSISVDDPLYDELMPLDPSYQEYLEMDAEKITDEERAALAACFFTFDPEDYRILHEFGGVYGIDKGALATWRDLSSRDRARVMDTFAACYPWLSLTPLKTAPRRDLVFITRRIQDGLLFTFVFLDSRL